MIPLKDLWKIKEDVVIHRRGKTRVIIAGFDLMRSGHGYTAFKSNSGSYNFRDDGYGTAWWCQPIARISKAEWDRIPENYKGRWDEWIRTQGYVKQWRKDNPEKQKKYAQDYQDRKRGKGASE